MKTNLCVLFVLLFIFGTASVQAASNPRWERTISHSPVSPREGQFMTFYTTIEALQGSVSKLEVRGGVDKVQVLSKTIPQLGRNQKLVVSFRWKSKAGNHKAYFQIDPKNKVVDINRGDNLVKLSFRVAESVKVSPAMGTRAKTGRFKAKVGPAQGAPLPDIVVTKTYTYNPNKQPPHESEFESGSRMKVDVELENVGQAPTGPFWSQLEVKRQAGVPPQTRFRYLKKPVANIAPGERKTVVFDIGRDNAQIVLYEFEFKADYNNRVKEFREDNNVKRPPPVEWRE